MAKKLSGLAAPFNAWSVLIQGTFWERIAPGAFRRTLESGQRVTFLNSHDMGDVLASTSNGSLQLREASDGLRFDVELADTALAADIYTLVKRGDMQGVSIGFRVESADDERWWEEKGQLFREILNIDLLEVSVVAMPAYPQTWAEARWAKGKSMEHYARVARHTRVKQDLETTRLPSSEGVLARHERLRPGEQPTRLTRLRLARHKQLLATLD